TGLPGGLTLDPVTGILSGTPLVLGTSNVAIVVTDPGQRTANATLVLVVSTSAITITTLSLPDASLGVSYSTQLTATGGGTPYTWVLSAGTLPTGLSLAANGLLSGTPTQTGTFNFSVTVSAPNSTSASRSFTLNVSSSSLTITTTTLNALLGVFFQQVLG